jgi:hypothetical protein
MINWDNRYAERVKLLVEILPTLAEETRFALKGGTAINLFEHDLPRLSVDIDLTWLPVDDFASDVRDISAALEAIGERFRIGPLRPQVQTSRTGATRVHRFARGRHLRGGARCWWGVT